MDTAQCDSVFFANVRGSMPNPERFRSAGDSRSFMEAALAGYTGALVVVTHDRRLRASFTGSRLELVRGSALFHRAQDDELRIG
ncbi:hypothetical protein [Streptomyces sp. NBC_00259]|uniref:hypothetical protein n=1 Tax=Streptomyces sp. NBC_00259 TaxID=2903643 RepID=UPI002E2E03AA|nr:hypothetical protein [Streptomyces sp. NBC_00259]